MWVKQLKYQPSNQGILMTELNLLKQYIATLQSENLAKNQEREKLYQQLSELSEENSRLNHELHVLRQNPQPSHSHSYILELQQNMHYMRADLDNLVQILQLRDSEILNINYQREKDTERINDLEVLTRDLRANEARMKQDLLDLKDQHRLAIAKLDECSDTRINQLIENYEKIEGLAKERNLENDELRYQRDSLIQEVDYLKKTLMVKDQQIKNLRKASIKKQECSKKKEQQYSNMVLIRQNNQLIERMTKLEKQKNTLYLEAFDGHSRLNDSDSLGALRAMTARLASNIQNEGDPKIRGKIQAIKSANQTLLENLRI